MKQTKKWMIVLPMVLVVIAMALGTVYCYFQIRTVDVFGQAVRPDVTEIAFSGDEFSTLSQLSDGLKTLEKLEKVDLGSFHASEEEMATFLKEFPGVSFRYVPLYPVAGTSVPGDTVELELPEKDYDLESLANELAKLKDLKTVAFLQEQIREEDFLRLQESLPNVTFAATVLAPVGGREFRQDSTELDLAGIPYGTGLGEELSHFPALSMVDCSRAGYELAQLLQLKAALPGIHILGKAPLGNATFSTDVETVDLNSVKIKNFDALKDNLALFYNLKKLELCDSGLSNEQMESLCQSYPDTKFVWRIHMGKWSLRTDAVAFSVLIYTYEYDRLTTKDIQVLKYCTDLQALDLGHQAIRDISVIGDYLKELRILILADNQIRDLTPLANLPHLHYLEFFVNQVTDLTPLAQCKELVDLNISYNYKLSDMTPILNLPLLERLWLEHIGVTSEGIAMLQNAYPNATIVTKGEGSIDQGWRTHERYSAMINMFRNNYMDEAFSKYDNA